MSATNKKRKTSFGLDDNFSLDNNATEERLISLEDSVNELKEQNRSLTKRVEELSKIVQDGAKQGQQEEELSDEEDSLADESDQWEAKFRQLREYRILNGHCNIPCKDPMLGVWIDTQKTLYRKWKTGKAKMKPERVTKLESIGFSWGKKFPPLPSWDEMFERLQSFQKRMGHCNVPFHASNPTPLAKWTASQRKEYKRFKKGRDSLLTLDEIGKLNEIGMNWKRPNL